MTDSIPITFGIVILQAAVLMGSSIVLSIQRAYQTRHLGELDSKSHLKQDTVRDIVNAPFSNGNRVARIIFETLVLSFVSGYVFVSHVNDRSAVYTVIGSTITFITWIYCLVLAVTSSRFPLPNFTGWRLNIHLFILYSVLFISSVVNLIIALWANLDISLAQSLPLILPVILGFDLIYTTSTVKNGSPFLDEKGKPVNSYNVDSIVGILYFHWMTSIVDNINAKGSKLSDEDLPSLTTENRPYNMFYIFGESRGKGVLKRIYLGNQYVLNLQIFFALVNPFLNFGSPFFFNRLLNIIQEITSGNEDKRLIIKGLGCIFGMSTFIIATNIVIGQLWFFGQANAQIGIKSMLNMEIYRKTLRRKDTSGASGNNSKKENAEKENDTIEEEEISSMTGMIVNLMSTDSARVSDFSSWWFVLFQAPLELSIGIYFLYNLLGWSSLLGLTVMVVTIPINNMNSKLFVKTQDQLMKARDKRVSLMNEVLQGIRQIKFFAWESNWSKRILEARNIELGFLRLIYITEVMFSFLWQGTPLLVTTVAFWSFTKLEGRELTAPIAFTSITIFNEMRGSLTIIPETVVRLFETLNSINRIEKYFAEEEIVDPVSAVECGHPDEDFTVMIGFKKATVSWPTNNNENKTSETASQETALENERDTFVLKDLDVIFPNDALSLICGATGSGKTLLMLSLLGETEVRKGSVFCPRSVSSSTLDDSTAITSIKISEDADAVPKDWILQQAVAYVSQTAWLQNASIRDNILFGLPLVQKRYKATLTACALDKDLSYLQDGDSTEIGEKGITLSGGQKARVALARAVYSRAQNILMDDVLSAVDAHTAKHLYKNCLLGPLMSGRTQILITHHVNLCIQGSSHVVFVQDGKVRLSASPTELKESNQLALIFDENVNEDVNEDENEEYLFGEEAKVPTETAKLDPKPRILVQEETRAEGTVKMKLYGLYFRLIGSWYFWAFIFFAVIGTRSLEISGSWWLKKWAQSYESPNVTSSVIPNIQTSIESATEWPVLISQTVNNLVSTPSILSKEDVSNSLNKYLGIYVLINMCNILLGISRYVAIYMGGLRASKELYILLLDRVFHAPLRFFDTTPVGRIVNRFAKDFETIDANVSMDIIQFIAQIVIVLSIMAVATSVLPLLIVLMAVVALVNIYFGLRFVSASRELKRMDSVSRSPLFTLFTETIVGVTTIRAFGLPQQFMLEMINRIDVNSRPMFYAWTISRWVSTRISLMGASITFITGAAILFNLDRLDASTAGFCLSYVLMFTNMIYWGVRRYTQLEMSFNAVERVVEFLEMDQEAPTITNIRPPSQWPNHGTIEVKNLHVRYAADLEPVLKGLSFSIKPKEKIGIVGRTGSGKSTLALAFFRFIEASQGSIVIDNVNIADIGTEDLRSNLTIIPQDPVLFSGTLGSNMDPFNEFTKEEIFQSLRRVHLLTDSSEEVNENVFKDLNTSVSEGGKNFSQGQRQLLCLARALLKSRKIVIMDEATASVDFETDKAIQKTITQEFEESTILCIAHRLNTIIEYDRILVLDHGEIVEFESPLELLRDSDSAFYKMCRNSGEFENLLELAKAKHELVDTT